jgi:hypothetical protein
MQLKPRSASFDWSPVAFAAAAAYLTFLAAMFVSHYWLRDADGHIIASDFIAVWAAGKLALMGHAPSVYDWQIHHTVENGIVGRGFPGYYGWHYPPLFLLVAAALALLPYLAAFGAWVTATFALYGAVIARIAGSRTAWLWALAFPASLLDAWVGQNGFFTAALFGAVLLAMGERPLLAGICLGILTYKPQFGVLFPFVLVAAGEWRALAAAALTAIALGFASWLAFGSGTWIAFFHSIPVSTHMLLATGHAGWNKLQSVYGVARWLGGGNQVAWGLQIGAAILACAGAILLWRSSASRALKSAALVVAALLATPYLYIYDFPVLAVAIAFLARDKAFSPYERVLIAAAALAVAGFVLLDAPTGLAATCFVGAIVARRGRVLARRPDVAPQRA